MKSSGRNKFNKFHFIIKTLVFFFSLFGSKINYKLLCVFRRVGGKQGLLFRYVFLKNSANDVGINVAIHPGVYMFNVHKLTIGSNVSIHPMCYIESAGEVNIGNNVSIAHSTSLISTNHEWSDRSLPIKYNPISFSSITIKDDVWIACGVRILAGVVIQSRSIIAAGAVVNKNVLGNSIYGGVPAKLIKEL